MKYSFAYFLSFSLNSTCPCLLPLPGRADSQRGTDTASDKREETGRVWVLPRALKAHEGRSLNLLSVGEDSEGVCLGGDVVRT